MKQEVKSEISRLHIMETAMKEFSTYSYKEASVNRICKEGNISKGKLYHYFESKERLYISCADYCLDFVYKQITEYSVDTGLEIEENIIRLFSAWQGCWRKNRRVLVFLMVILNFPPYELSEEINGLRERLAEEKLIPEIAKIFRFYFPDDEEKQEVVTRMTWIAIDYISANIGARKITLTEAENDDLFETFLEKQAVLFKRIIHVFLHGSLNV